MGDLVVLYDAVNWQTPVEGRQNMTELHTLTRGQELPDNMPDAELKRLKELGAVGTKEQLAIRRSVTGNLTGPLPVYAPTSPESAVAEARDDGTAEHTEESLKPPVSPEEYARTHTVRTPQADAELSDRDLEAMKVDELREQAVVLGIDTAGLTKKDLIAKIEEAETTASDDSDENT